MGRQIPAPDVSRAALARRRRRRMPRAGDGYVLYEGPGLLDGANIVVIVTMTTTNRKTGPTMAQTWILRDGVNPFAAWLAGTDAAVCGDCIHRGKIDEDTGRPSERSCYTQFHAMAGIYTKHREGGYPRLAPHEIAPMFAGGCWRGGAYGDPAAVPLWIWEAMASTADLWTGYTHQYRDGFALAHLFMASVETPEDIADALALGYRLYTVTPPGAPLLPGHIFCPGSKEGGLLTTCDECGLCDGARPNDTRKHIQSYVHGSQDKIEKFQQALKRILTNNGNGPMNNGEPNA